MQLKRRIRKPFHRKPRGVPRTPNVTATGKPRDHKGAIDQRTNPAVLKVIEEVLIVGCPYRTAAIMAGISESTFHRWMAEGKTASEGTLARNFWELVRKSSEEDVYRNVALIQKHAAKDWQAAAWFLSRRYPQDFGPTVRIIGDDSGKAIELEVSESSKAGIRAALRAVVRKYPDWLK